MQHVPFRGLVAATHTPFRDDGSLNLAAIEKQASFLLQNGVSACFIGGTTGESHSLSLDERQQLSRRWAEVAAGTPLRVVVHAGANCLSDAIALASQAQECGAAAVAALAPSYFKPRDVAGLIDWCQAIAHAAPNTPFYYYDIPVLTGVNLSVPEFLEKVHDQIANLAGVKFTNSDLMAFQLCLRAQGGRFDVLWGCDEYLLAAWCLGAQGAVGSSYNFAAPIYLRVLDRAAAGDLAAARDEQYRSVQLIRTLARYGYMGAAKATMGMLGVDVGAPRLPNARLTAAQTLQLRQDLEQLGFFDWVSQPPAGHP